MGDTKVVDYLVVAWIGFRPPCNYLLGSGASAFRPRGA
jgi:hypothetical protein